MTTGPQRNPFVEIAPPLFSKQGASFDLSIMEVNFVAVARPPNAMDTVGWRTWAPGLPQINTKTNCILTPVVLSMPRIQKQLQNIMEINDFEFGMCFDDVTNCCLFVLQYVAHIANVF